MKHMIVVATILMVAFAAISGGSVGVAGASSTIEAMPERRILTPGLERETAKGRPPDVSELQVSEKIVVAKIGVDDGDAVSVDELVQNDLIKDISIKALPSDNFTNGHILAAG